MKPAVAMFSGQMDSIAAVCKFAREYPGRSIALLYITSGYRLNDSLREAAARENARVLGERFPTVTPLNEIDRASFYSFIENNFLDRFRESLGPIAYCYHCLIDVMLAAIGFALETGADAIVTGTRIFPHWPEPVKAFFRRIAQLPQHCGLTHFMPVLSLNRAQDLEAVTASYGLALKEMTKYKCRYSRAKNEWFGNGGQPDAGHAEPAVTSGLIDDFFNRLEDRLKARLKQHRLTCKEEKRALPSNELV